MRRFAVAILAVALVTLWGSMPCVADQLPAPKTESVFPGITKICYANETFVFTTTVKLSATFEYLPSNEVRIRVRTNIAVHEGMSLAPGQMMRIYWEDGDELLYDGLPPDGEWIGLVQTEGGFTEK